MDNTSRVAAWIATAIGVVAAIYFSHDPERLFGFLIPFGVEVWYIVN